MLQVTFPEIVDAMRNVGSTVPAAEGHGCLCGALCISAGYTLDRWLEELVPVEEEESVAREVDPAIGTLYTKTVQALRGDQMQFEPFLPDDDMTLELRATALSQWCQGFLYGLGSARRIEPERMPGSIDEILLDFANIGRAEVEASDNAEHDEEAYAEVVEYVRAAVQVVHDELIELRAGEEPDIQPADTDSETV